MKKLFSLMLLFVATVLTNNAFAQGSLLATLNHEGTISTFYGAQAWKNAHDAAVNGDVITLSSGTFVAVIFLLTPHHPTPKSPSAMLLPNPLPTVSSAWILR